ncbi:MAG: hypothetical protein HY002_20905 [Candidatus Rokubacteria bacterium]|nr:hypothetical protein [Candidatus Rokubacteria bacterium]
MATSVRLGVSRHGRVVQEQFRFVRMYNLGFTMRDPAKMQAHLDEVVKAGVPAPTLDEPPLIMSFADTWTIRMIDPLRRETIEHTYRVPVLSREIRLA